MRKRSESQGEESEGRTLKVKMSSRREWGEDRGNRRYSGKK